MLHKIIIDIEGKNDFRTIVVEMVNTIEKPNVYTVNTIVTDGYKTLCKTKEIKGHEKALKDFIAIRNFGTREKNNFCGFEVKHKQTFITEKNPYISKMEYIKRFLWE